MVPRRLWERLPLLQKTLENSTECNLSFLTPALQEPLGGCEGLFPIFLMCQVIKQPTQRPAGTAQMMQVPERPWKSISMDVLGPFPPSRGFEHALVVVDRFSSLVRIAPIKKKYTTRDIVDALISKVYCYHGIPQEIISDREPQFVSNFLDRKSVV